MAQLGQTAEEPCGGKKLGNNQKNRPETQTSPAADSRGGEVQTRRGSTPVHEYEGDFYGQKAWFKVTTAFTKA